MKVYYCTLAPFIVIAHGLGKILPICPMGISKSIVICVYSHYPTNVLYMQIFLNKRRGYSMLFNRGMGLPFYIFFSTHCKTTPGGVKSPRFFIKKGETFTECKKLPNPDYAGEELFSLKTSPVNPLPRGIEPGSTGCGHTAWPPNQLG